MEKHFSFGIGQVVSRYVPSLGVLGRMEKDGVVLAFGVEAGLASPNATRTGGCFEHCDGGVPEGGCPRGWTAKASAFPYGLAGQTPVSGTISKKAKLTAKKKLDLLVLKQK